MSPGLVALAATTLLVVGCRDDKPAARGDNPANRKASTRTPAASPSEVPQPVAPAPPPDPYVEQRLDMVERTIEARGVTDPRVLAAMQLMPRHELVPPALRARAYEDRALPIGFGLTISQPYIVAAMTEAARIKPGDRVLEIGTGSGYQAAVLSLMGATVYTIELHEELATRTREVLRRIGFSGVQVKNADGWFGWPDAAPFDAIIVTCATPLIPDRLLAQLADGGRLIVPIGDDSDQAIQIITHTPRGISRDILMPDVRFGPMLGAVEAER